MKQLCCIALAGVLAAIAAPSAASTSLMRTTTVAIAAAPSIDNTTLGVQGTYFADTELTKVAVTEVDSAIDFDWGVGSPHPSLPADGFAVVWEAWIWFPAHGTHTFVLDLGPGDGGDLWIDDTRVIHVWDSKLPRAGDAVSPGRGWHYLTLAYYDRTGPAAVRLSWDLPGQDRTIVSGVYLNSDATAFPTDEPLLPAEGPCGASAHTRRVDVDGVAELVAAVAGAVPGDLIVMADGTYTLSEILEPATDGTVDRPIVLCGTRAAVIRAGTYARNAFTVRVDYWVFDGFSVRTALRGLEFNGATHNVLRNLAIADIGQEAIRFVNFSTHNVVEYSVISETGRVEPEYGEGVYIGSYFAHWCFWSGCQPDATSHNTVRDNVIGPNVSAEAVDIKAGVTHTTVTGNVFDGSSMSAGTGAWMDIQGSYNTIANNSGIDAQQDGFFVFAPAAVPGSGSHNVFRANTAVVRADGYGFNIVNGSGNTVACDNSVRNADGGYSNWACGG